MNKISLYNHYLGSGLFIVPSASSHIASLSNAVSPVDEKLLILQLASRSMMIQYSRVRPCSCKAVETIELVTNAQYLPTPFLFPLSRTMKANMVAQLAKLMASILIQPVARLARQDDP